MDGDKTMKKLLTLISIFSSLLLALTFPAFALGKASPKATGSVGYTANSFQRYADFNAHETGSCAWNFEGAYTFDFEYLDGHYVHDAVITNQVGGDYDIAGGYPAGGSYSYEWVGTGTVSGSSLTNDVDYTVGAVGTHMDMLGTIAPDGTMSGTWTDNYGGPIRGGTWESASGAATLSCSGKGTFHYSDANGDWYYVDVQAVKVDGDYAWFAGPVTSASNPVWLTNWLFAKVHDGGEPTYLVDETWGSFTSEAAAKAGVAGMNDPSDGPFDITSGNLQVHN